MISELLILLKKYRLFIWLFILWAVLPPLFILALDVIFTAYEFKLPYFEYLLVSGYILVFFCFRPFVSDEITRVKTLKKMEIRRKSYGKRK